jgi:predicted ATPase/class 3 adenylate cyclase
LTFLFTDLVGSTRSWDREPVLMERAVAEHDVVLGAAVTSHGGRVLKGTGDGVLAVFEDALDALMAAVDLQRRMAEVRWPTSEPLSVRVGLHAGSAYERDGDYFGTTLNRAARLMSIAHGGQILVSEAATVVARDGCPAEVELVDLGEHRLRDLSRPERVFQVCAPGLRASFPTLRSLDAAALGNLPLQVSSFVGRDDELRSLSKALGSVRVVTLRGVGGVGKTRLALQVAAERVEDYPDGAWLCELAPIRDPAAVETTAADLFAVIARSGQTPAQSLAEHLRDKSLLLVLDNCEHVLDAAAELVTTLVSRCPGVAVLATSREPMRIVGESVFPVAPLAVPSEDVDEVAAVSSDAVALFSDRAAAAVPTFAIDSTNARDVAAICRRLDGLPLAIELAAARAGTLPLDELARRLDQRFRTLGAARRGTARHQTLRAAIDWSYEMLSPDEQAMLARLSVFVGGWTLEACERITVGGPVTADNALDVLSNLVDKSLVAVTEDEADHIAYRLLETVREYASERLDERGETVALHAAHRRYYATWSERASDMLRTPGEPEWTRRAARDQENLRAAMQSALDTNDVDSALRLLAAAKHTPMFFLPVSGILAACAQAAADLDGANDRPEHADALVMAATHAFASGDLDAARDLAARAIDDEQRFDLPADPYRLSAEALIAIGEGRLADGIDTWAATIPADIARGDDIDLGMDHCMVALYRTLNDETGQWADLARRGLEIVRTTGNPSAIVLSSANTAYVVAASARPQHTTTAPEADVLFAECFAILEQLGRTDGQAHGLAALAATRAGDHVRACVEATKALEHRFWFPDRISIGAIFGIVAHATHHAQPTTAAELLGCFEVHHSGFGDFAHLRALHDRTTRDLTPILGEHGLNSAITNGRSLNEDHATALAQRAIHEVSRG